VNRQGFSKTHHPPLFTIVKSGRAISEIWEKWAVQFNDDWGYSGSGSGDIPQTPMY
jgi:hypothetical protein